MNARQVLATLIAFAIVMLFMWMSGCACVYKQEIREQHCAHVCIDMLGVHKQTGAYGSWVDGDRCHCKPWEGKSIDAGRLDDNWRPE